MRRGKQTGTYLDDTTRGHLKKIADKKSWTISKTIAKILRWVFSEKRDMKL